MRLEYTLHKNDFLDHQLFIASQSDRIKKKLWRARLVLPLIYIALGIWLFSTGRDSLALLSISFSVLWFLFYPVRFRRIYVRHFNAFIEEHHKNNFGETVAVELADDIIQIKDDGSESKVFTSELEQIDEIPSLLIVKLKSGQSLIISKNITDIEAAKDRLKKLAQTLSIPYHDRNEWRWK